MSATVENAEKTAKTGKSPQIAENAEKSAKTEKSPQIAENAEKSANTGKSPQIAENAEKSANTGKTPQIAENDEKSAKIGMNKPVIVKTIAVVLTLLILPVAILCVLGLYIQNEDKIYPNIFIDGINVSGLTRLEAANALGLAESERRIENVKVTVIFPDESSLIVNASDVAFEHSGYDLIEQAYLIGRGNGVMTYSVSYFRRLNADVISYDIEYFYDENLLHNIVAAFSDNYNNFLDSAQPDIYEDRIVFTKGAGRASVNTDELFEITYNELYQSFDEGAALEVYYTPLDAWGISNDLLELQKLIYVQVVSSEYDRDTNSVTESTVGVDFDIIAAAEMLRDVEVGQSVSIELVYTHPEHTDEELASLLFRDRIGLGKTWVGGTEIRRTNVEISSNAVNGLVLMPGEEFSFNETVGERTKAKGYGEAPGLFNGEFLPSIGGGICQTSSTIHAAIRTTGIKMTDQRPHGRPISYMPHGHDATVAWGYIDFKFENNTNYPLRIDITVDGRDLTVEVWGTIVDGFPEAAVWVYGRNGRPDYRMIESYS